MTSTREAIAQLRAVNPVPVTFATASGGRRAPARARARRRAGLLVAATAGVVAVAVGIGILPGGDGGASPAAAAALDQAATAADISATDEAARPDQYWRIETVGTHLVMGVGASVEQSRGAYSESSSTWLAGSTRTEYIAVDGSRPTWFAETPSTIVEVFSGDPPPELRAGSGDTWTSDLPPNDVTGSWQVPNAAWLASLPRDTGALRQRLYADTDARGRSHDGEALVYAADLLRSGVVPADLRAALFRVLETVPGVEIVRQHEDGLISIGRLETVDGERQEIVIDPATGQYVGERTIQMEALEDSGIPAGAVVGDATVTTTLVDMVPGDVREAADRLNCTANDDGAIMCAHS